MNPKSNEAPIQLPTPQEIAPNIGNGEKAAQTVEASPASGERSGINSPAPMPASIPLPTPPIMPLQTSINSSVTQTNPAQASDDTDLIEKEWVSKAKQIVEHTKDNPYQQSEDLNVYKADYMKKRYNRVIKLK